MHVIAVTIMMDFRWGGKYYSVISFGFSMILSLILVTFSIYLHQSAHKGQKRDVGVINYKKRTKINTRRL